MNDKRFFEVKQLLQEEWPLIKGKYDVTLNICEQGSMIHRTIMDKFKKTYEKSKKQRNTLGLTMMPLEFDKFSALEEAIKYALKNLDISEHDKILVKNLYCNINSVLKRCSAIMWG